MSSKFDLCIQNILFSLGHGQNISITQLNMNSVSVIMQQQCFRNNQMFFGCETKQFVMVLQYLCMSSYTYIIKIFSAAYTLLLSCRHFVAELSVFVKSHRRSKYLDFQLSLFKGCCYFKVKSPIKWKPYLESGKVQNR